MADIIPFRQRDQHVPPKNAKPPAGPPPKPSDSAQAWRAVSQPHVTISVSCSPGAHFFLDSKKRCECGELER